ncbi:MAG: MBL fold metallo-hydrolase [Deltaproteobacteria bacterium]|nr:MBL fold metallo-hydrolase [Deltaproteobacteria bacterium]
MSTRERNVLARSFQFRGGTRINGTVIACDATSGGDLLFLSNALALGRYPRRRGRTRSSRAQILTTTETLALSGTEGDRLRTRALVVAAGRPFTLGALRLELLPSGHLPGATVLSCETGSRRILYAGAARLGTPAWGAAPGAVRAADALCIDATFGHPRFKFLSREEAEATACQFVRASRDAGCAPVLLAASFGPAQDIAPALAAAGWRLRGHRSTIAAAAAYRRAGVTLPAIARFSGALAADEVLLWPAAERDAGRLGQLGPTRVAWVSGWAADAGATARLTADVFIPYSSHADFAGLMSYVVATGAREVATEHGFAEDFAAALRERDIDAYVVGPPQQIPLAGY